MKTLLILTSLLLSTVSFANSKALNKKLHKQLEKEYTRELNLYEVAYDRQKKMYVDFDAMLALEKTERKIDAIERLLRDDF